TLGFLVVVIVFGIFGLPISGLIAGAGVVGLAIGFGAQGIVSDVVTGFFILVEKWADVGDYIITAEIDGVVEEIGLRTTKIRRSEEHTSELQSRFDLVCRLLLEK